MKLQSTIPNSSGWTLLVLSGVFSSVLTLILPSTTIKLLVILLISASLFAIRTNPPQILLLITFLPVILQIKEGLLSLAAFAIVISWSLFFAISKSALGRGHFSHHRTLDIVIAINIFFAINTFISSFYNSSLNQFAFMEMMRFLLYAGLIAVAYNYIKSIKDVENIVWVAMFGSIAFSLLGYKIAISAGAHTFDLYGAAFLHASSVGLANANTIATVIANPLPIFVSYILFGKNKSRKFLYFAVFLIMFVVWLVWNSRASYIYLFSAILVLILFNKNRWKFLLILIVMSIIVVVLTVTRTIPILTDFLRLEMGLSHREDLWLAGIRMIAESPLLGKGPTYYDLNKFNYMDPGKGRMIAGPWYGISPHNVLIMRGVDMGAMAMIAQLLYWVVPLIFFIRNSKKTAGSDHYYLYLACGAIWIGLIFRSQFDTGASVFSMIMLAALFRLSELIHEQTAKQRVLS